MVLTSTYIQTAKRWTALHFAIGRELLDVVKLLIENGADLNTQNAERLTSLHFAIMSQLP